MEAKNNEQKQGTGPLSAPPCSSITCPHCGKPDGAYLWDVPVYDQWSTPDSQRMHHKYGCNACEKTWTERIPPNDKHTEPMTTDNEKNTEAPAVGFTITRLGRRIEVVDVSERYVWYSYHDGRSGAQTLNCPRAEWADKLARTVAISGTLVEPST